jgi:biopolymer transport protein ExbD
MRFTKGRKEEEPRLGIAPLIDIVFLLLIFFMVTSQFDLASGVRLDLPEMKSRLHEERRPQTTVVIDGQGRTYLEGERMDGAQLEKRLAEMVKKEAIERIILQADREARHGLVVEIIDRARSAGVGSVVIAARWDTGKSLGR